MVSRIGSNEMSPEHDLQDQLIGLWEIIHRHLGLVLSCLAIIFGLGALYYLKATRTYESEVDILIFNRNIGGLRATEETGQSIAETVETHAIRLQSPLIIGPAVQNEGLASLPSLVDQDDPVNVIIDSMSVALKDENAAVLNVKYRGPNPNDCKEIVTAIAKTYETFLGEVHQKAVRETTEIIEQANVLLRQQMVDSVEAYRDFQRTAPLMWRDGQGVNVHHERQSQIEVARQKLMVEKTVLEAKINALDASLVSGGSSREAVWYEALSELKPDSDNAVDLQAFKIAEQEQMAEREAVRQYSSLLMGEYVRLMVERSELLDEFGEGHPKLNSVSQRKSEVKKLLNSLLTQDVSSGSGLMDDLKADGEKDYVEIYMQMLRDRLGILDRQIGRLDTEFQAEQKLANVMQDYLLQDQAFRAERDNTKLLFDEVVARLKEVNLVDESRGDSMSLLAHAEPGEQVAPRILYVAASSLFLGCLFGTCLAWILDRSENTFRNAAEIRQKLNVPVIGRIPYIKKRDQVASTSLPHIAPIVCTLHKDKSFVAESFRSVRTSLYFSAVNQNLKVIQVTSPLPGDGKSTVTANLAVAIAKSGKRVLVMDADFRRPTLAKLIGKPRLCQHGLAAVIAGKADPVDASLATDVPNLFFLPALERPLNPSELLSTPQFKNLLELARERFDFVLIDTPPVLAVTDPCAVAAQVDGVLLTLRIRKGVHSVAARAVEMLHEVDAKILGTIVNGVEEGGFLDASGSYGRYGDYGVYEDQGSSGVKPKRIVTSPMTSRR